MTEKADEPVVLTSADSGVLTITLNRPRVKNAVNLAVAEAIAAAVEQLDGDDSLRAGILTGTGETFCAGMDLKAFASGEMPVVPGKGFGGIAEAPPRKPLIAAVEGYVLAGGLELAIACDLIVAADNCQFGIPEAKRGLAAGAGGLIRLPRQIPSRVAMELALTGDFIDAGRALALGLVNRLTPPGGALAAARELAAAIAANGPLAVAASKAIIQQQADWPLGDMFAKQNELLNPVFHSEDAIEGAVAFSEKRPPKWKGK